MYHRRRLASTTIPRTRDRNGCSKGKESDAGEISLYPWVDSANSERMYQQLGYYEYFSTWWLFNFEQLWKFVCRSVGIRVVVDSSSRHSRSRVASIWHSTSCRVEHLAFDQLRFDELRFEELSGSGCCETTRRNTVLQDQEGETLPGGQFTASILECPPWPPFLPLLLTWTVHVCSLCMWAAHGMRRYPVRSPRPGPLFPTFPLRSSSPLYKSALYFTSAFALFFGKEESARVKCWIWTFSRRRLA